MLVASLGGHLHELAELQPRLVSPGTPVEWMAAPGPQTERLGQTVHPVRDTAPRDWGSALRNLAPMVAVLRRRRPVAVVSTGAAIALPALTAARALGIEAHYVESAARTLGPSLTGRLLAAAPGLHLYTQWPAWAGPRWRACGSVFDGFSARPRGGHPLIRRVVVTLGTQAGYGFRALVERLVGIIPAGAEVLWQVGATDVGGLGIDARARVDPDVLARSMAGADLVVAHAGIGSALTALAGGRLPVLVPRRQNRGEHVDDHQATIAAGISGLGLAAVREVGELTAEDLETAASQEVVRSEPPRLRLEGRLGALE